MFLGLGHAFPTICSCGHVIVERFFFMQQEGMLSYCRTLCCFTIFLVNYILFPKNNVVLGVEVERQIRATSPMSLFSKHTTLLWVCADLDCKNMQLHLRIAAAAPEGH